MDIHEYILNKGIDSLTELNGIMICDLIEEYTKITIAERLSIKNV